MLTQSRVGSLRVRAANDAPPRPDRAYVVYWMTMFRRVTHNFALERAMEWARSLDQPLIVLEPLRLGYPWASDRLHRFVLDGMADNERALADTSVLYYPYVEREIGAGRGLLAKLASRASVVVTDDYPCFFVPRMIVAAGSQLRVRLEAIDSNGFLPIRAAGSPFARAHDFRRFLQRLAAPTLDQMPLPDPLSGPPLPRLPGMPRAITERWPRADEATLRGDTLAELPIDHSVPPAPIRGGSTAARERLQAFLKSGARRYAEDRSHPDEHAASGLSPWLHFGHISTHEVMTARLELDEWSKDKMAQRATGSREGFWNASADADSFLDELLTWREVGFNMCATEPRYDQYDTLPSWARETLAAHAGDARPYVYTLQELEQGQTHDPLWNAAQRELRETGVMQNYLRMLWGKKILEWTPSPEAALAAMIELNNKYGVDGRDPNSYSGIFWVLGRYDRPWGPERPIYGKIRYMTSDSARRKLRIEDYLTRFGEGVAEQRELF